MKPFENAVRRSVPARTSCDESRRRRQRYRCVVPSVPARPTSRLVQRLIGKYDRGTSGDPKDGRLSCAELGSAAETLRRFDTDGDGGLSPAELTALLGQPVPDSSSTSR